MSKIYMQFEAGTKADGTGINFLSGENEDISIYAEIEIPEEEVSEDYGYLSMKEAILNKVSADIAELLEFQYDGQEAYLNEDAKAEGNISVEVE